MASTDDQFQYDQHLPRLLAPVWKTRAQSRVNHYHIPDCMNMGATVDKSGTVWQSKTNSASHLGAKVPAFPLVPPNNKRWEANLSQSTVPNDVAEWNNVIQLHRGRIRRNKQLKAELQQVRDKLTQNKKVKVEIPSFVYQLANKVPITLTPAGMDADEFFPQNGGTVRYQPLPDSAMDGVLLHSSGKRMNTLGDLHIELHRVRKKAAEMPVVPNANQLSKFPTMSILVTTPVDLQVGDCAKSWLKLRTDDSCSATFSMKLHSITCKQVAKEIYCGARQAKDVVVGKFKVEERGGIAFQILTVERNEGSIADLALSPYIGGEYVYVTPSGKVKVMKVDGKTPVCKFRIPGVNKHAFQRHTCHFASHPRSVLLSTPHELILKDLREGYRSVVPIYQSATSEMAYPNESLHVVQPSPVIPYLHYLATSYSFHLMDERFPGHPVLTWKHQMTSAPTFCHLSPFSTDGLVGPTLELALLASSLSRDSVLFLNAHDGTRRAQSLSAPLHLSSPKDFVGTLLGNGYSVDPLVRQRTSANLAGVHCFSPASGKVTVLQQTVLGDVFYQNFEDVEPDCCPSMDCGHKDGPGYQSNVPLDAEVALKVVSWTEDAMGLLKFQETQERDKQTVDATVLLNAMMRNSNHSHNCPLCCECPKGSYQPTEASLDDVCSSCGIRLEIANKIWGATDNNGGVLTGRLPESLNGLGPIPTAPPLEAAEPETIESNDFVMQRLLRLWRGDETEELQEGKDTMEDSDTQLSGLTQESKRKSIDVLNYSQSSDFNDFVNSSSLNLNSKMSSYLQDLSSAMSFTSDDILEVRPDICVPVFHDGQTGDIMDSALSETPKEWPEIQILDVPRRSRPTGKQRTVRGSKSKLVEGF